MNGDAGLAQSAPGVDAAGKACGGFVVLIDGVAPLLCGRLRPRKIEMQFIAIKTAPLDIAEVLDGFSRTASAHRDERLLHQRAESLVFIQLVFRIRSRRFWIGRSAWVDVAERSQSFETIGRKSRGFTRLSS